MRGLISSSICVISGLLWPFLNGKKGGRGAFHFSPALLALLNSAHRMGLRRSVGGHLQIGLTDDVSFSDHLLCHQHQGPTMLLKTRIWVSVKSGMCLCLLWFCQCGLRRRKRKKPGSFSRSRFCLQDGGKEAREAERFFQRLHETAWLGLKLLSFEPKGRDRRGRRHVYF